MKSKTIERVEIAQVGSKLIANAVTAADADEAAEFAFYIFRNDQRIDITWYSKQTSIEFDVGDMPGFYRVEVFVRGPDNESESAKSNCLTVNPVVVDEDAFPAADPNNVAYLLKGKHWEIPAMYFPGPANRLFVVMPSAVERASVTLPVFSRWSWATKGIFPGHVLFISDPTLALREDLGLAWCLGTAAHCATDEIAGFVSKFAAANGIPNQDIVFYGSSAGGFAALAAAAKVPGSTAVAINAQTDAFAYARREQVALASEACFGSAAVERVRAQFADRLDMVRRWSSKPGSRVIMVQNELDVHHYEGHFKPFWESLGGTVQQGWSANGVHRSWVYSAEGGHVPETIPMAKEIISILTGEAAPLDVDTDVALEYSELVVRARPVPGLVNKFSFLVFKDKSLVYKQDYSDTATTRFDTGGAGGNYEIVVFVLSFDPVHPGREPARTTSTLHYSI